MQTTVDVRLPEWLQAELPINQPMLSDEAKMQWVIALSKKNIEHETGGPFACAIFDDNDQVVSVGVNCVTSLNNPVLHAETTAIMMAHAKLQTYHFDANEGQVYHLFTSTEPCLMCLGACLWSGIKTLICAARDEDATAIGFDEGPKPENWVRELARRGINVKRDLCREQAVEVLQFHQQTQGLIYGNRIL